MIDWLAILTSRLAMYAYVAIAIGIGYSYWAHHERNIGAAPYKAQIKALSDAIEKQKESAAALLKSEQNKTASIEARLNQALQQQEHKDAINDAIVSDLTKRLAAARLRDPGARSGSGGPASATAASAPSGAADNPSATGLLSAEATGFLRDFAREADEVNAAYASCRADSFNIREQR